MTITIIIVVLIAYYVGSSAWKLENLGNSIPSNEEISKNIRHKMNILRIWFWVTLVLSLLFFSIFLVNFIKDSTSSEPWINLVAFIIIIIILFITPFFLLVCIKRQKNQLINVEAALKQLKDNHVENHPIENNQEKSIYSQMGFWKNDKELYDWQKPNLSDIVDNILICKEERDIVWCYFNKKALVDKIHLAMNGMSPYFNFDIKWLQAKCEYIRKGDDLCIIKSDNFRALCGESTKTIKAPASGYYYSFFKSHLSDESLERGDVFCAFFKSTNDLIEYSNFNVIEVVTDDFTRDIIVRGKVIVNSLDWCEIGVIKVNFENRMGEYSLLVRYSRMNFYVRKNDTIMFLFENGTSISLNALSAPITCTNCYGDSIIRYRLNGKHIRMFKELSLIKWQLKSYDGEKLAEGDILQCGKLFNEIFKNFVAKFESEVIRSIPTDILQKSQQEEEIGKNHKQSSCCYVYLMKDTANNYYKIGISNKPEYREKTLQSEKPSIELVCCKEFPSRKMARALESALHSTYSEKHIRGEWFELNENDVSEIIKSLS